MRKTLGGTRGTALSGDLMFELLLGSQVWRKIRAAAKGKGPRRVAVAYLGPGAHKRLPLRQGDTLIVDLSPEAVRAGSTSVAAARAYYRLKVRLYSFPRLHSKVFVLGDVAILGSANVSTSSEETLEEAAVLIDDRKLVTKLGSYIASLALHPVTPSYLRQCDAWNKETAAARAKLRTLVRKNAARLSRPRLWLFESEPYDGRTDAKHDREAQARVKKPHEFLMEPLFWSHPPELRRLDSVIIAHKEAGKLLVLPPSRFLYQGKSPKGETVVSLRQSRHYAPKVCSQRVPRRSEAVRRQAIKMARMRRNHLRGWE